MSLGSGRVLRDRASDGEVLVRLGFIGVDGKDVEVEVDAVGVDLMIAKAEEIERLLSVE